MPRSLPRERHRTRSRAPSPLNSARLRRHRYPPARDFAGYYMKAFETVVQRAKPEAIMCRCGVTVARGPRTLYASALGVQHVPEPPGSPHVKALCDT